MIRAVAASGGVIGVCAAPFFLARGEKATLSMLIDHAAYIADLCGPAHVGLGFRVRWTKRQRGRLHRYGYDERVDPKTTLILARLVFAGHAEAGNVAPALRTRGFAEAEIKGVLGGNFLRVFGAIWGG